MIKNFTFKEFRCPCGCVSDDAKVDLLEALQVVRDLLGLPMVVTSGVRCESHNSHIGAGKGSSHILGLAADILIPNSGYAFELMTATLKSGKFSRVGFGKMDETLVMHLDIDKNKIQKVLWGY